MKNRRFKRTSRRGWEGCEQLEQRQCLSTVLWDGGGNDLLWSNPLNWSGDVLPGPADDVVINAAGEPTILHNQNTNDSVRSISSTEAIHMSVGTISVAGTWQQDAPLTVSGGRIDGAGDLMVNGSLLWSFGTIAGSGNIQVIEGRMMTIAGNVELDRSLINGGRVYWAEGNIVANGSTITNQAGHVFFIRSPGSLTGVGSQFVNQGLVNRRGFPTSTTTIGIGFDDFAGSATAPAGTVAVHSGTLALTGDVAQKQGDTLRGGRWSVTSSDGTLLLPGENIAHVESVAGAPETRVSLIGAGAAFPQLESVETIRILTLAGGRGFTFANHQAIGTLTILGGSTVGIHVNADTVVLGNGAVTMGAGMTARVVSVGWNAPLTLGGSSTFQSSARGPSYVFGAGLIRVEGEINWLSGAITGPGQLLIDPSGHVSLNGGTGAGAKTLTRRTVNYGTIDWDDANNAVRLSGDLVNRGTFDIRATDGFLSTAAANTGRIHNFGTMNVSDSVTLRNADGGIRLINTGTVNVQAGTLTLSGGVMGGGMWTGAAGTELIFGGSDSSLTGATMSGEGRIRIANRSNWTNVTVSGTGDMVVGTAGELTLLGSTSVIGRSAITNNGVLSLGDGAMAWIDSNLTNAGTLSLGTGDLTIAGDLTLTPTSTLRLRSTDAVTFGELDVQGMAALDGGLVADFGWAAPIGTEFNFLTAGDHTGDFATVSATGLPAGMGVGFQMVGDTGMLTVQQT